jgi:hypothetical protein
MDKSITLIVSQRNEAEPFAWVKPLQRPFRREDFFGRVASAAATATTIPTIRHSIAPNAISRTLAYINKLNANGKAVVDIAQGIDSSWI